jgi:hypothetical protein
MEGLFYCAGTHAETIAEKIHSMMYYLRPQHEGVTDGHRRVRSES